MNEDFVTYEIAKKLKEKGFREKCLHHYNNNGILKENYYKCYCSANNIFMDNTVDAPAISQVLKWLITKKAIFLSANPFLLETEEGNVKWYYNVKTMGKTWAHDIDDIKEFSSYEQAALAGIEYVLDNII